MVGISSSRWLTVGLGTMMAASLVVGSSAAVFAQDEDCPHDSDQRPASHPKTARGP